MNVYTDMRWPAGTGIGRMAAMYSAWRPPEVRLVAVPVAGSIGSPLSPFRLSAAVSRAARPDRRTGVFWSPGFIPIVSRRLGSVVTVHDLTHLHYYKAAHRHYYNFVLKPMYRRCDAIVCVSNFTRDEFLEWSGVPTERVSTVHNAIEPGFADLAPARRVERPFVFYPGNQRNYKNLDGLIRGFAASGLANEGFDVVLTGSPSAPLVQLARALNVSGNLRFLGFISDADLVGYYKAAACVAFLSRYEGFGLPLLEAMCCKVPLVVADASSLPEVAGDAALLVDPDDIEQIAGALREACCNAPLRTTLIGRGTSRLAAFDIRRSAQAMWSKVIGVADRGN